MCRGNETAGQWRGRVHGTVPFLFACPAGTMAACSNSEPLFQCDMNIVAIQHPRAQTCK